MPAVHPPQEAAALSVRSFARTDIGRHRATNEDSYFRDDNLGLYVVADGMGGHAAGEVASAEAVETVFGFVKRGLGAITDASDLDATARLRAASRVLEGAIQAATYMVFALAELDQSKSGMGTTITSALVADNSLITGQVGDSRIYQIRDGKAVQVTEDHTLTAWQVKQGIISEAEAKTSPHRNVITRAVGNRDYVEVDISILPMNRGDRYLLCSDGLHGYLRAEEIGSLTSHPSESVVDKLIDLANARGGRDNITAIWVEVL